MTYRTARSHRLLEALGHEGKIPKRYNQALKDWMQDAFYIYVKKDTLDLDRIDKSFTNKVLKPELGNNYAGFKLDAGEIMGEMLHYYNSYDPKIVDRWANEYLEDTRTDWWQEWHDALYIAVVDNHGEDYWDYNYN